MLVSICVPVYKVEKQIERCVVRLMEQSYDDLEFVFVDDHSPDSSMQKLQALIEMYPQRKSQVKIINHECNRGLSAARNTALSHCMGDFVLHVDSDDYLAIDAVKLLVERQKETGADIVTGQAIQITNDNMHVIERPQFRNHDDFVEDIIIPSIRHAIWGRLIRKTLYTENHIAAKEGVNIGEDLQVMAQLAFYATKLESVWDVVYYYDCTNGLSYMNQYDTQHIKRLTQDTASMEIVRDFFIGKSDKFQNQAEKYLCDYYLKLMRYYGRAGMSDDFAKICQKMCGLRPQNRQMPKKQKMKFSNYRIFRITESLLK
jgi:glycosyltransferase involved in cell wall biosynthesis